jgi:hypothetical protein
MSKYHEYNGLNYEQASREGYLLVRRAAKDGNWTLIVERLADLRQIMDMEFSKAW